MSRTAVSPARDLAMVSTGRWLPLWLVLVAGTAVRLPQLLHSLADGNAFRQTQTAVVVREYADHGINLLHTPLPVFGPGSDVPMEMPIAQALAALIAKLGVPSDVSMRLVGLVGFQASALLLFLLVERWHGRRPAFLGLLCFEFLPFGLAWGAASLIEFPAVALALAMVYGLDRWFREGQVWWLVAGAVSASLGFLVKITTALPWSVLVVASALVALTAAGRDRRLVARVLTGLAAGPTTGLAMAVLWTRYADGIKEGNPLTEHLTSKALTEWNFGTVDQRLDLGSYATLLERLNGNTVGALVLLGSILAIARGHDAKDRILRGAWIGVALSGPLVFLNLYIQGPHTYYLCAVYAGFTVLVAFALDPVVGWLSQRLSRLPAVALPLALAWVLALLSVQGVQNLGQWLVDEPPPSSATLLAEATSPDDKIVVVGCQWNPALTYFSGRTTLMLPGSDDGGYWAARSGSDGVDRYAYLFQCDTALDPAAFLPEGHAAVPTRQPGLLRIQAEN